MEVTHDRDSHRFVASVEEGEAYLAYSPRGDGVLDLQHTFVSPAERGEGVGTVLVRAALDYARERGLHVIPTCPFARKWINEHPQYADLVSSPGFGAREEGSAG